MIEHLNDSCEIINHKNSIDIDFKNKINYNTKPEKEFQTGYSYAKNFK